MLSFGINCKLSDETDFFNPCNRFYFQWFYWLRRFELSKLDGKNNSSKQPSLSFSLCLQLEILFCLDRFHCFLESSEDWCLESLLQLLTSEHFQVWFHSKHCVELSCRFSIFEEECQSIWQRCEFVNVILHRFNESVDYSKLFVIANIILNHYNIILVNYFLNSLPMNELSLS